MLLEFEIKDSEGENLGISDIHKRKQACRLKVGKKCMLGTRKKH